MGPFLKNNLAVPEPDILLIEESLKILVDPHPYPFWPGYNAKHCRFAVPNMDRIREHVEDCEIVLDNDHRAPGGQVPDKFGSGNPLVDIEERGDLIEEVQVRIPGKTGSDRNPLEFPAAQRTDVVIEYRIEFEFRENLGKHVPLVSALQERPYRTFEDLGNIVNILGFRGDLQRLFGYGLEEIEQLCSGILLEDLFPCNFGIEIPEVGPELAGEDLDCRALPDTIGTEDTGYLAFRRDGETIQSKAVLAIAVGRVFQFLGKADDIERPEGAFLDTDAAADAEFLRNNCLALRAYDNRFISRTDAGAVADAFLAALLRMAAILMNNG